MAMWLVLFCITIFFEFISTDVFHEQAHGCQEQAASGAGRRLLLIITAKNSLFQSQSNDYH
jgi:hypothetical protein